MAAAADAEIVIQPLIRNAFGLSGSFCLHFLLYIFVGGSGVPSASPWGAGRLPYSRGSLPNLASAASRQQALAEFVEGIYATSSAPAVKFRRHLYGKILLGGGFELSEIGPDLVYAVGASLKGVATAAPTASCPRCASMQSGRAS